MATVLDDPKARVRAREVGTALRRQLAPGAVARVFFDVYQRALRSGLHNPEELNLSDAPIWLRAPGVPVPRIAMNRSLQRLLKQPVVVFAAAWAALLAVRFAPLLSGRVIVNPCSGRKARYVTRDFPAVVLLKRPGIPPWIPP